MKIKRIISHPVKLLLPKPQLQNDLSFLLNPDRGHFGYTLVELVVVSAILVVLVAMAYPALSGYLRTTKNSACVSNLGTIDKAITAYIIDKNALPASLDDVGLGGMLDPWKRKFVYQIIVVPGSGLKDTVANQPLNTDYDLYSKGEDGASTLPGDNPNDLDDIVRSNDGSYIGVR